MSNLHIQKHHCKRQPAKNWKSWEEQDEVALMAHTLLTMDEISKTRKYWIGDTGATTHVTNNLEGILNCASPPSSSKVVMGNGSKNK